MEIPRSVLWVALTLDDTHRPYTDGIDDWRVPLTVAEAALTCGSGCLTDAKVFWTQVAKQGYNPKDYSVAPYADNDHANHYDLKRGPFNTGPGYDLTSGVASAPTATSRVATGPVSRSP
jgi:hypothetical protein